MNQSGRANVSSEIFHVAGMSEHSDALKKLARLNPDWNLSPDEIISNGKASQKIYRLKFISKPVELQNDSDTGALNVIIAGHHIGYIRSEETAHAKDVIKNYDIQNISCGIWGGQYKTVDELYDVKNQQQGISVTIRITYDDWAASLDDTLLFEDDQPSKTTKTKENARPAKKAPPPKKKKAKKSIFKRWWFWAIIVLVLVIVFLFGGNRNSEVTPAENDNPIVNNDIIPTKNPDSAPLVPRATTPIAASLEAEGTLCDYDVQIHDFEIAKDYSGKPAILIGYTFTNNSEENASAIVSLICDAYQNGVELDTAIMMDDTIYNSSDSMKEIQPGASIDLKAAYVLTSDTAPVEFEVAEAFALNNDQLGKTFEISAGGVTELRAAPSGSISESLGTCTVSIVSYKLTEDYEGKKAILFELGFTNNTSTANNYMSTVNFSAFQNGVELEMAILVNEASADSNSMLRNVKPGAGIPVTVAYVLSSETDPVSVEIEDLWGFSGNKIQTEINLG